MAYISPRPAHRSIGRLAPARLAGLTTYLAFVLAFAFTAAFVLGLVP